MHFVGPVLQWQTLDHKTTWISIWDVFIRGIPEEDADNSLIELWPIFFGINYSGIYENWPAGLKQLLFILTENPYSLSCREALG